MKNKGNIVTKDQFILDSQEIKFINDSNFIRLNHKNHPYKQGDIISVYNLNLPCNKLSITNDDGTITLDIPKNADFMKILFPHHIQKCDHDEYYEIELLGVKGFKNDRNHKVFYGIPIDIINTKHKIFFELDASNYLHLNLPKDYFAPSTDYFFIKFNMVAMFCDENKIKPFLFKLIRHYIAGISTDHLLNLRNGTVIKSCDNQGYEIELCDAKPLYNDSCKMKNITVSKIVSTKICGQLNNYVINLGKTYNNIYSVKLCSTEFPNMRSRIFVNDCCLNWINYDETTTHKIYIKSGCYTLKELAKYLTEISKNNPCSTNRDGNERYLNVTHCEEQGNEYLSFKSYKYIKIYKPFKYNDNKKEITIYHTEHNMKQGTCMFVFTPKITNHTESIKWCQVTKIIDKDYYIATVMRDSSNNFEIGNFENSFSDFSIFIPQLFYIQYSKCSSFCELLKISNNTKFSNCIKTKYFNDTFDYFYMIVKPFQTFDLSTVNIYSPFAKIQLGSNDCCFDNKILYNTFVDIPKIYYDPIKDISSLEVSFVDPTGIPINFGNLNHSFTLEFITIDDSPNGSLMNPNTMKSYGLKVTE